MVAWAEIPCSPGRKLQNLLAEAGFDTFIAATCKPYCAPRIGGIVANRAADGPERMGACVELHLQALKGEDITIYGTATNRAPSVM